ncbi:MAG: Glu/Leu/Phe/Val dehydrogenase, partial [Solirubrobacterales bacterium]|nr:Glu/Leu/Phe/Val dehydrogenase [Solirubrobacterales bacterium]
MPKVDLEQPEHEELILRRGKRSGLYTIVAVHSTVRGPSLGGCRMWHYPDPYLGVNDALRLSRAMTFKSAVANLPLGGGKGVIVLPEEKISAKRRKDALYDFAETVDLLGGRYITAEDVGTSARDMSVIASETKHVAGLARKQGGSGDPSPYTALGVVAAIKSVARRSLGVDSLAGLTITVIGAGHVGGRVAKLVAKDGAKLILADVDKSKRELASSLGARWLTPEKALYARADVLAPCALGGVLTPAAVPQLQTKAIAGAANNQLEQESVAKLLTKAGILWAPDFVANAGGIINICQERGTYDPKAAAEHVKGIGDTLEQIFDRA